MLKDWQVLLLYEYVAFALGIRSFYVAVFVMKLVLQMGNKI